MTRVISMIGTQVCRIICCLISLIFTNRVVFNSVDTTAILSIPLGRSQTADALCWKFERKGGYTVKSAYKSLTWQGQYDQVSVQSSCWNRVWRCKIPYFLLNFLWRAGVNILPSRERLFTKHVPVVNVCPLCQRSSETVLHILVQCPYAREVWLLSPLGWFNPQVSSFLSWLDAFTSLFNKWDMAFGIYVCWNIWQSRNRRVWQQKFTSPAHCLGQFKADFEMWRSVQRNEFTDHGGGDSRSRVVHWKKLRKKKKETNKIEGNLLYHKHNIQLIKTNEEVQ
ncbi:hypothetical protein K2173_015893 [Erythroxylum novogranatense]|uniref:Reverse transcriptase zinc-binding domain-containing protein n=1 Tax=Erythroxylum novogranatense TaxID=1862640 RepID=A0AAV8SEN0_9ROSI|nr:hypothetical protein K2173_015893 [Erythroxylum novogranatense]